MKSLLHFQIVGVLLLLCCGAVAAAPVEKVPDTFLRTEVPAWKVILATEITMEFRNAEIREVIGYLARKAQANMVFALEGAAPPAFTRTFDRAPLRTVLYQLSQDTGVSVGWLMTDEGLPRAIQLTDKRKP